MTSRIQLEKPYRITLSMPSGVRRFMCFVTGMASAIVLNAAPIQPSNHPDDYVRAATDTANIEAALNAAAAAGPGQVVELAGGTFLLNRPLAIVDFDGVFKGQGSEMSRGAAGSIVRTIGDDAFPLHMPPLPPVPELFAFYYVQRAASPSAPASITVKDMTIKMVGRTLPWRSHAPIPVRRDANLVTVWGRLLPDPGIVDPTRQGPIGLPTYVDVAYLGLELKGVSASIRPGLNGATVQAWAQWEVRTASGVDYVEPLSEDGKWGPITGSVRLMDSHAERIKYAFGSLGWQNSSVTIANVSAKDTIIFLDFELFLSRSRLSISNVQAEQTTIGAYLADLQDSDISITGSRVPSIAVLQGASHTPSRFDFAFNDIAMGDTTGWSGIELHGLPPSEPGARSPIVTAYKNTITSLGYFDVFGPIFSEYVDGLALSNNVIIGIAGPYAASPEAAIYVFNSNGARLVNNDLHAFSHDQPPIYLEDCVGSLVVMGTAVDGATANAVAIVGGTDNKVVGGRAWNANNPASGHAGLTSSKLRALFGRGDDD